MPEGEGSGSRRRPLWRIAEPTTTLTDLALAVLAGVLALSLLRHGAVHGEGAVLLWGAAFVATSGSALLGGVVHGFAPWLTATRKAVLWQATLVLIGLTDFLLVAAVGMAELRGGARTVLLFLAGLKLACYLALLRKRADFGIAAADSAVALLAVLAIELFAVLTGSAPGAGWIIAGVVLSVAGAAAQAAGIGFHRHFNHNDLFHVVQMGAAYLFYRGGLLL